jgi:hypothetical protein
VERTEQPRTHADHQHVGTLAILAQLVLGEVLLREVLSDTLQPLDEARRVAIAKLTVHHHQQLVVGVGADAEIVASHLLAKVGRHRAVWPPAEALRHLEPVAVQGPQLDDPELVQTQQVPHALGLADRVRRGHLLEAPLAEGADRQQQELAVGDDGRRLFERELAVQRLRVGDLAGEFGAVHLQHAQHRVDAPQRHVALGEDALDARFGLAQLPRQVGVGDAGGLQFVLQRGNTWAPCHRRRSSKRGFNDARGTRSRDPPRGDSYRQSGR